MSLRTILNKLLYNNKKDTECYGEFDHEHYPKNKWCQKYSGLPCSEVPEYMDGENDCCGDCESCSSCSDVEKYWR